MNKTTLSAPAAGLAYFVEDYFGDAPALWFATESQAIAYAEQQGYHAVSERWQTEDGEWVNICHWEAEGL